MFSLVALYLEDSLAALRNCFKELWEKPGYVGVFAEKKTGWLNIERLLLITKEQTS